ncbi:MAG: triose-phosphate isomerase [Bryobacteraceae bacterium]|nr:triose-phosphate isomerase [Bryobacteraceae bacterium]
MRTPLLAGNWKMYKDPRQTRAFFDDFLPAAAAASGREIVICPPFLSIPAAVDAAQGTAIGIGAQNLHFEKEGAFTGEVSAAMIAASGARWVIVGHSERRQFFGETDASVLKKTVAALVAGLRPIVCLGEMLAERESGRTDEVLERQFSGGIAGLAPDQFSEIVIAYEPVWAIGTGRTATPETAQEAHRLLRELASAEFGAKAAGNLRILYGGSVKPDNIQGLMAQPDLDGALVGGASLDAKSFASIVNF